jgi:hypothetical protein
MSKKKGNRRKRSRNSKKVLSEYSKGKEKLGRLDYGKD